MTTKSGRPAAACALPWGVPEHPDPDAVVVDPWVRPVRDEPTTFLRAAVRPRMLGILALLLLAAAACGWLGTWQLDRAHVRGAASEAHREAALAAAPPTPLDEVLAPQRPFTGAMVGRRVSVTGSFATSDQVLVEHRVLDGRPGYWVLSPLRTPDGAVLPVVRGWVATPDAAGVAPAGSVEVVGFLQASEGVGGGVVDGRAQSVSSAELVNAWGGPIYTGYLVLQSSDPAQAPGPAALPQPRRPGSGLNLQNLLYAAQWWVFGGFAVVLWLRMVRDEARGGVPGVRSSADPGTPGTA